MNFIKHQIQSNPGYGVARYGHSLSDRRTTPEWINTLRRQMTMPIPLSKLVYGQGFVSYKFNRVIHEFIRCVCTDLAFKSKTLEYIPDSPFRLNSELCNSSGVLLINGVQIAKTACMYDHTYQHRYPTIGYVSSFNLQGTYDKYYMLVLRWLGVPIYKVGRKVMLGKSYPIRLDEEIFYHSSPVPFHNMCMNMAVTNPHFIQQGEIHEQRREPVRPDVGSPIIS